MSLFRSLPLRHVTRFFQQRWKVKAASLIIAILVFYGIRSIISAQHTFTVPVVPVHIPGATVTAIAASPPEVQVTLRGTHAQLSAIRPDTLRVEAFTRRAPTKAGQETARLRFVHPRKDFAARVREVSPTEVTLTYDDVGDVVMAVAPPRLIGEPLSGEAEVAWTHTRVTVRGSRKLLSELKERGVALPTEAVDVSGTTRAFVKHVKVLLPKDIGQAQVTPAEIEVTIRNYIP